MNGVLTMGLNWKIRNSFRRGAVVVLFMCITFLCACSTLDTYEEHTDESATEALFSDYIYDDNQPQCYTASGLANSENGYYYIHKQILYFYDIATDVNSAVCSKLECNHNSSKCDAYVQRELSKIVVEDDLGNKTSLDDGFDEEKGINCVGHMIFYHNQHIFMIERRDEGDYLVQYDSRFNNKETLSLLTEKGSVIGCTQLTNLKDTAFLSGDYLYYMSVTPTDEVAQTNWMTQVYCYRVRLASGAVPEKLGAFDRAVDEFAMTKSVAKVCGVGNKVYYITSLNDRLWAKEKLAQYRVAVYDTDTGIFQLALNVNADKAENALGAESGVAYLYNCCVDEKNNVYFPATTKLNSGKCSIFKLSLDTLKVEKVISFGDAYTDISNILYNKGRIYIYGEHSDGTAATIKVYCIELENNRMYECEIPPFERGAGSGSILGADERYLMISNGQNVYIVLTDAIEEGNCSVKEIK